MKMRTKIRGRLPAAAVLVTAMALSVSGCLNQGSPTPIACIHAEPTIGSAPLTITFDASCSFVPEGAEGVYHFQWEFEDGSEGTGRTTVHTFTEPGTYTVAVIMIRTGGRPVDVGTRVVTVLPTE